MSIEENVLNFKMIPPVDALRNDVECFRVIEYKGTEAVSVKVCPNGKPGLIFEFGDGLIRSLDIGHNKTVDQIPSFYLYGQVKHPSVMHYEGGSYTTIQTVLKPHAISALFGIDSMSLTEKYKDCFQLEAEELYQSLENSKTSIQCISLLTHFLLKKLSEGFPRDVLVEQSLHYIDDHINTVQLSDLLNEVYLSERQFQKRFLRTVGLPPHFYIRIRRFNEAVSRIGSGHYPRLCDVAHSLHYYDHSHFIREIKQFSATPPKSIFQKASQFHHDLIGASYLV